MEEQVRIAREIHDNVGHTLTSAIMLVQVNQVVATAQGDTERNMEANGGDGGRFAPLTQRERDIAALVAQGLDNRQIAAELFLSEGTVRNRISDILAKTNISNRTKLAVEWVAAYGLQ